MKRAHEPGVDPPMTEGEERALIEQARSMTNVELRQAYRAQWEALERASCACDIFRYEAVRRHNRDRRRRRVDR